MTLKVACVGGGYFSQFHLGSWRRMEGVTVVGVADRDRARAAASGYRAFESAAAMIAQTQPDIVDIITPPDAQAEIISAALGAGVKTIICQKPFCLSLEQAKEMAGAAARAGAMLVVHENFRFMPWYRFIRSELDEGRIGDMHQVTFRLRPGDGQGPEAYLDRQPYFQQMPRFLVQETAVHWIDTFRYLLGNPISVYADLRQLNPAIAGEDAGLILFEHSGGVRALFDGNRHLDHASDNLRRTMGEALFEGSAGTLCLYGDGRVDFRAFGQTDTETLLPPDTWPGFGGDCVHALQRHVIDAIRFGNVPENTACDYCEVLRIRDAIYLSAEEARRIEL